MTGAGPAEAASAHAQRSASNDVAPRPRARVARRAPRPPTRRRSAAAPRPRRRTRARRRRSPRSPGGRRAAGRRGARRAPGATGWPVASTKRAQVRVDDREAADAHAGERDLALLAGLAEPYMRPAGTSTKSCSGGTVRSARDGGRRRGARPAPAGAASGTTSRLRDRTRGSRPGGQNRSVVVGLRFVEGDRGDPSRRLAGAAAQASAARCAGAPGRPTAGGPAHARAARGRARARRSSPSARCGREIVAVDDSDTYVCRPHAPGEIADALVGPRARRRAPPRASRCGSRPPATGRCSGCTSGWPGGSSSTTPRPATRSPTASARSAVWDRFTLRFADGGRLVAARQAAPRPRAARAARSSAWGPTRPRSHAAAFRARVGRAARRREGAHHGPGGHRRRRQPARRRGAVARAASTRGGRPASSSTTSSTGCGATIRAATRSAIRQRRRAHRDGDPGAAARRPLPAVRRRRWSAATSAGGRPGGAPPSRCDVCLQPSHRTSVLCADAGGLSPVDERGTIRDARVDAGHHAWTDGACRALELSTRGFAALGSAAAVWLCWRGAAAAHAARPGHGDRSSRAVGGRRRRGRRGAPLLLGLAGRDAPRRALAAPARALLAVGRRSARGPSRAAPSPPRTSYLWLVLVYTALFFTPRQVATPAGWRAASSTRCRCVYDPAASRATSRASSSSSSSSWRRHRPRLRAVASCSPRLTGEAAALGREQRRLAEEQASLRRVATAVAAGLAAAGDLHARLGRGRAAARRRRRGHPALRRPHAPEVRATGVRRAARAGDRRDRRRGPDDDIARVRDAGRPIRVASTTRPTRSRVRRSATACFMGAPVHVGAAPGACWASTSGAPTPSRRTPRCACAPTPSSSRPPWRTPRTARSSAHRRRSTRSPTCRTSARSATASATRTVSRARRHERPLTVAVVDVDRFRAADRGRRRWTRASRRSSRSAVLLRGDGPRRGRRRADRRGRVRDRVHRDATARPHCGRPSARARPIAATTLHHGDELTDLDRAVRPGRRSDGRRAAAPRRRGAVLDARSTAATAAGATTRRWSTTAARQRDGASSTASAGWRACAPWPARSTPSTRPPASTPSASPTSRRGSPASAAGSRSRRAPARGGDAARRRQDRRAGRRPAQAHRARRRRGDPHARARRRSARGSSATCSTPSRSRWIAAHHERPDGRATRRRPRRRDPRGRRAARARRRVGQHGLRAHLQPAAQRRVRAGRVPRPGRAPVHGRGGARARDAARARRARRGGGADAPPRRSRRCRRRPEPYAAAAATAARAMSSASGGGGAARPTTRTAAATTRGSNCVPAQRSSSATALSWPSARR